MNMENNITTSSVDFGGKEAEALYSTSELAQVIKMFEGGLPEITRMSHNCSNTQMLDSFGSVDIGDAKDSYFGLRVYKRNYVPLGEIWLQDKEGKVVRKFSLPNNPIPHHD